MLLRFLNPTFVGFLLLIIIYADKEDAASVFSNFLGIATLVYLVNGGTYSIIVFQLHNKTEKEVARLLKRPVAKALQPV